MKEEARTLFFVYRKNECRVCHSRVVTALCAYLKPKNIFVLLKAAIGCITALCAFKIFFGLLEALTILNKKGSALRSLFY